MASSDDDPVGQLIAAHAMEELFGYRGNLVRAKPVPKNKWFSRRLRQSESQDRRLRSALAIGRHFVAGVSTNTQQAVARLATLMEGYTAPQENDWFESFNKLTSQQAEQLAQRCRAVGPTGGIFQSNRYKNTGALGFHSDDAAKREML